MRHKESNLQIKCVHWFRNMYPECARLLEHPKNEGHGDNVAGAISKAEGVQAGVADLILHIPSERYYWNGEVQEEPHTAHSLAIEMKTKTGRQSPEQKIFQRFFEAAGNEYVIVRSLEEFQKVIKDYMVGVNYNIQAMLRHTQHQIDQEQTEAARKELQALINKQK